MINRKDAILVKEIDGEIIYVHPQTRAELVECNTSTGSMSNMQERLDVIEAYMSNTDSANLRYNDQYTIKQKIDSLDGTVNNRITNVEGSLSQRITDLTASDIRYISSSSETIKARLDSISSTASNANTTANAANSKATTNASNIEVLQNNIRNLSADNVKYSNSLTVKQKLDNLSDSRNIYHGTSNLYNTIVSLQSSMGSNDTVIKNALNKICDYMLESTLFTRDDSVFPESNNIYNYYEISVNGNAYPTYFVRNDNCFRIGNAAYVGLDNIEIELDTRAFGSSFSGGRIESTGNIVINNFINRSKYPNYRLNINFGNTTNPSSFDILNMWSDGDPSDQRGVDYANHGNISISYDISRNQLIMNNVYTMIANNTRMHYSLYRSDNATVKSMFDVNNWWE